MSGRRPGPNERFNDVELRGLIRDLALAILADGRSVTLQRLRDRGVTGTWSRISRIREELVWCGELPQSVLNHYERLRSSGNGCKAKIDVAIEIAAPHAVGPDEQSSKKREEEAKSRKLFRRLAKQSLAAERRVSEIGQPGWFDEAQSRAAPMIDAALAKRRKRTSRAIYQRRQQ